MSAKVVAKKGEDVKSLFTRLKRQMVQDGTIEEVRRRQYYEKPSEVRNKRNNKKKLIKKRKAIQEREIRMETRRMKRR